jgi:ribosomal protein S27AE
MMGRKQASVLCVSCESPLRADSPFCPTCGRPTVWATHDERVGWEVRQWRASRAREGGSATTTTMMLVRTEAGYQPSAVRSDRYIWDQPLHPEREAKPNVHRPTPRETPPAPNGNGHQTAVAPTAIEERPSLEEPSAIEERPALDTSAPSIDEGEPPGGIGISKKAVAVGILLAVGLPLSGKALSLARSGGSSAKAPAAAHAAGSIQPLALMASRSGFTQVTPDAVRYAVVIRNPNKGFAAFGVGVAVSMYDRNGRLIGTTIERLGAVPAGGSIAVAGHAGVAGRVAKIKARTSVAAFERSRSTRRFVIRGVQISYPSGGIAVRASVSGVNLAHDAKVVAVYFDRAGNIVGGDFTFVDVPSASRTITAVVSTSGVGRSVGRVEVYVVASQ